jgi:ribulose kinase
MHLLLQVNSGGAGPVSAEWMVPKALWLFQEEPDTYTVGVAWLDYFVTFVCCSMLQCVRLITSRA